MTPADLYLALCILAAGALIFRDIARINARCSRLLATADYTRERAAMVEHLARQRAEWRL